MLLQRIYAYWHWDFGLAKFLQHMYPIMGHFFGTFQQTFAALGLSRVEAFSVPIIQQLTTIKNQPLLPTRDLQISGLKGLNGWIPWLCRW